MKTAELSIGRDPDGEVNLALFIEHDNQISLSISKDGRISWCAQLPNGSVHGMIESKMADALYFIIDQCVEVGE